MWDDLAGALDDAFARNVDKVTGKSHKKIQRDYKNFVLFREASRRGGAEVSSGRISPNLLVGANKRGTRDFDELARAGVSVFGTKAGNSGTPDRLLALENINPAATGVLMTKAAQTLIPVGSRIGLGQAAPTLNNALAATGRQAATSGGILSGNFSRPDFEPNRSSVYDAYR